MRPKVFNNWGPAVRGPLWWGGEISQIYLFVISHIYHIPSAAGVATLLGIRTYPMKCEADSNPPQQTIGYGFTYTTKVPRYRPSPMPSITLPTINMAIVTAPASRAAPRPNIRAPIAIFFGRPSISAIGPAKKEDTAAGIKIEEIISPWTVADGEPNSET